MATAKTTSEYLTIQQICEMTQTDRHTVNHWIDTGQLKSVNLGTEANKKIPRKRVRRDWFEEFIQSRSTSPAPVAPKRKPRTSDATVTKFIK